MGRRYEYKNNNRYTKELVCLSVKESHLGLREIGANAGIILFFEDFNINQFIKDKYID